MLPKPGFADMPGLEMKWLPGRLFVDVGSESIFTDEQAKWASTSVEGNKNEEIEITLQSSVRPELDSCEDSSVDLHRLGCRGTEFEGLGAASVQRNAGALGSDLDNPEWRAALVD